MSLLCKLVPERCIACGLCQIEAPDIFDYDEEGIVLFAQEPEAHQQFVSERKRTRTKSLSKMSGKSNLTRKIIIQLSHQQKKFRRKERLGQKCF